METSGKLNNDKKGKQYDIDIRSVIAFWEIRKGYAALESFCYIMSMPLQWQGITMINL